MSSSKAERFRSSSKGGQFRDFLVCFIVAWRYWLMRVIGLKLSAVGTLFALRSSRHRHRVCTEHNCFFRLSEVRGRIPGGPTNSGHLTRQSYPILSMTSWV